MPRGRGKTATCVRCVLTWSLAPGVPCLAGVARERGGGGIGEETVGHSSWPAPAPAAARDAGYPRPTFLRDANQTIANPWWWVCP